LEAKRRAPEKLAAAQPDPYVTNHVTIGPVRRPPQSQVIEENGRHVGTRTPDLYRVNFEVGNLNPLSALLFRAPARHKIPYFRRVLVTNW